VIYPLYLKIKLDGRAQPSNILQSLYLVWVK